MGTLCASHGPHLVLDPDLMIIDVNEAYLRAAKPEQAGPDRTDERAALPRLVEARCPHRTEPFREWAPPGG